jgi:hypothetical protein
MHGIERILEAGDWRLGAGDSRSGRRELHQSISATAQEFQKPHIAKYL